MKRAFGLVLIISIIVIGIAGCSSTLAGNSETNVIIYNDFIAALQAKKYTIKEIEPPSDGVGLSFFSVIPKRIEINGQGIVICEFENSGIAKLEAQTISEDGNMIGNSMFEWIDIPHFYQQGNLIVEYTGSNKKLLDDLSKIVGKPITNQ